MLYRFCDRSDKILTYEIFSMIIFIIIMLKHQLFFNIIKYEPQIYYLITKNFLTKLIRTQKVIRKRMN